MDDARFSSLGIASDPTDLRDMIYAPSLRVLPDIVPFPDWLTVERDGTRQPSFGVRDQGASGRCGGYAMAALVDFQRRIQAHLAPQANRTPPGPDDIVSADMLYSVGVLIEGGIGGPIPAEPTRGGSAGRRARQDRARAPKAPRSEGLLTLRSVVKGFYHHGACRDVPRGFPIPDCGSRWQSSSFADDPTTLEPPRLPNARQARAARGISLGAYYRVRAVLNDMHAAISEAGAVLVAANVHQGWADPLDPKANGRIMPRPAADATGAHAFVVVGYDEMGFLVLNSLGPGWGGAGGVAGIGHWSYADWAQHVLDAWVLRLGVPAPASFETAIGEQGWARAAGLIRGGSTPRHEMVGHYLHLDDGFYVRSGAYPSGPKDWRNTQADIHRGLRGERARRGLLIWLPGGLEGIKPAFARFADLKRTVQGAGLYPFTLFWCQAFVDQSLTVLKDLFERCKALAGDDPDTLDAVIEREARGIGRAIWRDLERSARRAVCGTHDMPFDGDETDTRCQGGRLEFFLDEVFGIAERHDAEVHIVADNAGALLLHELIRHREHSGQGSAAEVAGRLASLHLVLPSIGIPRASTYLIPLMREMNARRPTWGSVPVRAFDLPDDEAHQALPPPARVYLPTHDLEARMRFGVYGRSSHHLIARSFEDRLGQPDEARSLRATDPRQPARLLLGAADAAAELEAQGLASAVSPLTGVSDHGGRIAPVQQRELSNDPAILAEILRTAAAVRHEGTVTPYRNAG